MTPDEMNAADRRIAQWEKQLKEGLKAATQRALTRDEIVLYEDLQRRLADLQGVLMRERQRAEGYPHR